MLFKAVGVHSKSAWSHDASPCIMKAEIMYDCIMFLDKFTPSPRGVQCRDNFGTDHQQGQHPCPATEDVP